MALLVLTAPIISVPSARTFSPEVVSEAGTQFVKSSWSDHLTSILLKSPVANSFVAKHIACLSLGDTSMKFDLVGADVAVTCTALVELVTACIL